MCKIFAMAAEESAQDRSATSVSQVVFTCLFIPTRRVPIRTMANHAERNPLCHNEEGEQRMTKRKGAPVRVPILDRNCVTNDGSLRLGHRDSDMRRSERITADGRVHPRER